MTEFMDFPVIAVYQVVDNSEALSKDFESTQILSKYFSDQYLNAEEESEYEEKQSDVSEASSYMRSHIVPTDGDNTQTIKISLEESNNKQ